MAYTRIPMLRKNQPSKEANGPTPDGQAVPVQGLGANAVPESPAGQVEFQFKASPVPRMEAFGQANDNGKESGKTVPSSYKLDPRSLPGWIKGYAR